MEEKEQSIGIEKMYNNSMHKWYSSLLSKEITISKRSEWKGTLKETETLEEKKQQQTFMSLAFPWVLPHIRIFFFPVLW